MLNKKILVKSITSLSEARYCAGMFVDYISFDFNAESEYYIPKKNSDEIRGWLSGVKILGSFETNDSSAINQLIEENNLDGFIFTQNQYTLLPLVNTNVKILQWEDVGFLPSDIEEEVIVLIDLNEQIDKFIPENMKNVFLQGFDFENVKYETSRVDGYAFMGSFEKQVGINSYQELMEAFEYIDDNY